MTWWVCGGMVWYGMNASINSAGEEVAAETKGIKRGHKIFPECSVVKALVGRWMEMRARCMQSAHAGKEEEIK
jgi:hypothetical protein